MGSRASLGKLVSSFLPGKAQETAGTRQAKASRFAYPHTQSAVHEPVPQSTPEPAAAQQAKVRHRAQQQVSARARLAGQGGVPAAAAPRSRPRPAVASRPVGFHDLPPEVLQIMAASPSARKAMQGVNWELHAAAGQSVRKLTIQNPEDIEAFLDKAGIGGLDQITLSAAGAKSTRFTDRDIAKIVARVPNLKALHIVNATGLTNAALQHIQGLRALEMLELTGCNQVTQHHDLVYPAAPGTQASSGLSPCPNLQLLVAPNQDLCRRM
jgi:hypothetical protein